MYENLGQSDPTGLPQERVVSRSLSARRIGSLSYPLDPAGQRDTRAGLV